VSEEHVKSVSVRGGEARSAVSSRWERLSAGTNLQQLLLKYGMFWTLILVPILGRILYSDFLSAANINNMVAQVAPVGVVAVGMTYVIIAGGFDLSVGSVYAGASVTYASFANSTGSLWAAFVLTLGLGALCGAINGFIITVVRVNAFVTTLSTASLFSGLSYLYAKNSTITANSLSFGTLGNGKWGGVWITVYLIVGLIAVAGLLLARTPYGRKVYAIGGNREAARLAGIRVNLTLTSTYVICGACAAVAGMITASQIGVGEPGIGSTITLSSIAIVIIGGTSLLGGEGSIWRTIVGIAIWGMLANLFNSLAFSTGTQLVLTGLIVLFAVALDALARRTRK
jgi:ribose transport system permease protein